MFGTKNMKNIPTHDFLYFQCVDCLPGIFMPLKIDRSSIANTACSSALDFEINEAWPNQKNATLQITL